jgi:uroporphyrin-3 C-methyltransferase
MTAEAITNTPEAKASPAKVSPKAKMSASGKLAITLSLLLAAGGVGGAGYLFLHLESTKAQIAELQQNAVNQQQTQKALQSAVEQKLAAQSSQREAMHKQILNDVKQQLFATNAALQARIAEVSGRQPAYWLIAEARYLVDLAEKRLNVEHDYLTAVELLMSAEKRLAELSNGEAFSMRQLIAKDISAVQIQQTTNKAEGYQSINRVMNGLDKLAIKTLDIPELKVGEGKESYSAWDTFLTNLKQFSQHIFRVNYYRGEVAPFISPEQQALIRANLRQQLLTAQTALLRDEPKVYYAAIAQTQEWLTTHFLADNADFLHVEAQLKALADVKIEAVNTLALQSAAALKTWLHSQPLPSSMDKPSKQAPVSSADSENTSDMEVVK